MCVLKLRGVDTDGNNDDETIITTDTREYKLNEEDDIWIREQLLKRKKWSYED